MTTNKSSTQAGCCEAAVTLSTPMRLYFKCMQHRTRIFFCFVILNALLLCTWVIIPKKERIRSATGSDKQRDDTFQKNSAKQEQSLVESIDNYDQQREDIFNNNSTFSPREVTIYDIKRWQQKFYASLVRVGVKPPNKVLKGNRKLTYNLYSENKLDNFTRINVSLNKPRQSVRVAKSNGLIEFPGVASCKPLSPDVVLYNRIFKTGSETTGIFFSFLSVMMDYFYTKQTTEDFYDQGISKPYPMIIERKTRETSRQVLFNAHFYFRNDLKIYRTHTYVNQVREPIARYISHYTYMRSMNRPTDRIEQMIESGEWNETIEECFEKQGQGCRHNVMTRFFCGTDKFCKSDARKALERAKQNILHHYAVIGLLEHFQLTLKILQYRLPYFVPVVPKNPTDLKINEGAKSNKVSMSEEMIFKIKQANWADVELYEFIKELFWKQVHACGIS